VGVSPAWGQDPVTIYSDADYSSEYVPFDGYNADAVQHNQMIIPSTVLTSLSGKTITSMTFYYKTNESSGTNVGNWIVSMAETNATSLASLDTTTPLTQVFSGAITPNTEAKTITITFDDGYDYNGGNLLVDFNHPVASGYKKFTFWCAYISPAPAFSRGSTRTYLPKTTFTYEESAVSGPGFAVKDGSTKLSSPYAYSFGLTAAGTTKTFKLTNPGNAATPISVDVTGANGFTAAVEDNATSIPAGGEKTLTITMPNATASGSIVVTPTGDGLSAFTFNVSGTAKDPSKLWCDFTSDLPSGWDNTGGWAISNSGADGITSGGGYASNTSYGTNKRMFTPLVTIAEGEKMYLMVKGHGSTSSWNKLYIQYSANGTDWTTAKSLESITNAWQSVEVTEIPAGNWYIAFYGSYVHITDIYGGTESTAPVLSLSLSSYDFGLINENTTSTAITITNTGKSELTGMNLVSSNAAFTSNVTGSVTTIAANGGTATFTVTMSSANAGTKNGTITIKSDNADDLVLNVSGAVMKAGTTTAVFNDATLAGWTKAGNTNYNNTEEAAYFYYSTNTLTSPKVTIVADDFLAINAKLSQSYGYVTVQGSIDGSSWTDIKKLDSGELNQADYTTAIVSGISTDYKYLRLNGYYCYVKQVAGLTYAPVLVVKDAEEATQTTGLTYPFGEISANQTVSYTFTNAGAGTINITNVESSNSKFTTNFDSENKPAVTSAAPFTLTITANYDAESAGEQNGAITVTTSEGDFVINLTSTFMAANAPTLTVDNTLNFGKLTANDTQTVTVTNSGTGSMTVGIVSDNALFTVSPAELTGIGAGASKTFDVTFHYDQVTAGNYGVKNANITVTPTYNAEAAIVINASAKAKDPEEWSENFAGNAKPDGWDAGANWTFAEGKAKASYDYSATNYLTTPSLTVTGETDGVTFDYEATSNYVSILIQKSKNGGAFTDLHTISGLNNGDAGSYTITGLEAGNYKFRFKNDDYNLDNFEGLKLNLNDPTIAVYSDALATQEVATATTKDFGWVADDADAAAFTSTYYIKNNGTGTLTISNISEVEGFTAATAENATTVSGENTLALTITMDKNAVGEKSGTFTLTTDGGNFTIPVKGFVYGDRNLIDFSSAAHTAGWNKGTWTIDENVASVAAASTMQTTSFVVNANEKLYVEAKRTADNYHTGSLSYSYSINNGESWTDGDAALFSATGSSDYDTYTISDIAGNEERTVLIRFNGAYAAINRIYGFEAIHVAEMVVSQTDPIAFGMQTAETTETSFTISNANGSKTLEGLSVTLGKTGEDAEYEVRMEKDDAAFTGTEIAVGEVVTVYVKQLFDINKLGAKSDVLTIAATDQTPVAINLSGATRDASKLYVDFDGSNDWPTAVASHGANWEVYAGYARQNSTTASSLVLAPLTISQASEALRFKASRVDTNRDLTVRYTTNGGVTWNDYNFGTNETPVTSLKEQITSSFSDFEITNIPAGPVAFDFYGKSIKLDNITADYSFANAPLVAFTKVTDNISDANLTADAEATYTLANIGNADYVGIVAKANVNVAISGDGVTYEGNTLTIPAGKTAEITVTMPFAAPYGAKNGSMTITSESWVGEVAVNYTANLIDPDAINVDFASLPAGWYNAGWTVNGSANVYSGVEQELITEQYAAEAGKNVLSFKAKAQSGNEGTLKVYTSTDRKTWSEPKEFALSGEYATKSLDALADGNSYYVKFVSLNANIDDLTGLKKIATVPEHDLYVYDSDIPTATKVPETSITATATVYSLRANEEGVYAKLFFDETVVATADGQNISLNGSQTFELTGNVPATEKTYHAKIVVYYGDNSVAFETLTTDVEVQHTRTLAITAFERVGEGDLSADVDNKITAQFNVTVQNNSTCALTADEVKVSIVNAAGDVYQMNDADNVTAATAVLAKDESVVIPVTLTISAGEGGDFKFRAKELVSNTTTLEANDITIHVNAQAPQFALNIKGGAALADGDDVAFGLVKEATTKQYTISNTGTKELVLTSIVAPAGYSVTEINDVNKTIAANGTLDIDVTLLAEQGKKAGNLVFTYNVNGTPTTFTLALTGRSEAANVWEEYFATEIPASWQKTGWTWNADRQTAYSGGVQGEFTLMTPRLSAAADQVLTYETKWQYAGDNMTVQYSTDKTSWTDYETVTASTETVEHQFVAPAAGNYYLKFTANRYVNLDNFIGFALNIPEHDMELAASVVPTTGKRLNSYVATVTLKENAGKNEDITAELWVAGAKVNATADVTSVGANSNATVVTLTWEPQSTMDAVNAYVKVTYAGGTLETTPVSLTIAEVYTLSENSSVAVEAVNNETVMLQRTFAAGWNTICLPFAVGDNTAIETLFGAGAKVFNFKNFANSMIEFEAVTSMTAATPYLIYVPAAVAGPIRVNNVTITGMNTTAGTVWHNNITFHGSYAPVAAGGLTDMYGVTTTNKLAKGNANTTMKGFRAYFEGTLAGARIYTFDDATGISHVYQAAEVFGDDDRVYNMNGQHVENAKKGVYIVNGRKVVIK
jgi:hypothetical protein